MNPSAHAKNMKSIVRQLQEEGAKSDVDLVDVLNLGEVMISSIEAFFGSIDKRVYSEFRSIADYINKARVEIAALQPADLQKKHLPRAGQELDAIVKATESATHTIMENAEAIMSADPSDPDAYHATVQTAVMQIFEACSFQDITGQRVGKVVTTLQHIEDRVTKLADAFGFEPSEEDTLGDDDPAEKRRKEQLLNGPQLDGEGIDQSDVDALFGGDAPTDVDQDDIDALFD